MARSRALTGRWRSRGGGGRWWWRSRARWRPAVVADGGGCRVRGGSEARWRPAVRRGGGRWRGAAARWTAAAHGENTAAVRGKFRQPPGVDLFPRANGGRKETRGRLSNSHRSRVVAWPGTNDSSVPGRGMTRNQWPRFSPNFRCGAQRGSLVPVLNMNRD